MESANDAGNLTAWIAGSCRVASVTKSLAIAALLHGKMCEKQVFHASFI
jgi:hypothetical protein